MQQPQPDMPFVVLADLAMEQDRLELALVLRMWAKGIKEINLDGEPFTIYVRSSGLSVFTRPGHGWCHWKGITWAHYDMGATVSGDVPAWVGEAIDLALRKLSSQG